MLNFLLVRAPNSEADCAEHVVHDLADVLTNRRSRDVKEHGFVSACDIKADARRADRVFGDNFFILKGHQVVCFDTFLQVLILEELGSLCLPTTSEYF
jgi:hypothetical protein